MSALLANADTTLLRRFNAIFDAASANVVGRDNLILPMKLALLTRNHVLLVGKPGVAKSMLVRSILGAFKECETFQIQCTKRMSEEYLVGPLDMRLFRTHGEYRHITDGSMVTADLAFLDEFLDLPDQSLRALLEIFNERRFTRGKQREQCNLHTAFAATNFAPNNEQVEAVQDRFLFRCSVQPLEGSSAICNMLKSVSNDPKRVPKMPYKWLRTMCRRVSTISIDPVLLEAYAHLSDQAKRGLNLTDRRIVWTLEAVKAYAYLQGRDYAQPSDFVSVSELTFMLSGDDAQAKNFSSAVATGFVPHGIRDEDYARHYKMQQILRGLSVDVALWQQGDNTIKVDALKEELTDFAQALTHDTQLHAAHMSIVARADELAKEARKYVRILEQPQATKEG